MSGRTYYHVLGVSREATQEEITNAKNALAKIYHPDANMHNDIDTTKEMQEILESGRHMTVSWAEGRAGYSAHLPWRRQKRRRNRSPLYHAGMPL